MKKLFFFATVFCMMTLISCSKENEVITNQDDKLELRFGCDLIQNVDYTILSWGCSGPPNNTADYRIRVKPNQKVNLMGANCNQSKLSNSNGIVLFEEICTSIQYTITVCDPVTNYCECGTFTGLCN